MTSDQSIDTRHYSAAIRRPVPLPTSCFKIPEYTLLRVSSSNNLQMQSIMIHCNNFFNTVLLTISLSLTECFREVRFIVSVSSMDNAMVNSTGGSRSFNSKSRPTIETITDEATASLLVVLKSDTSACRRGKNVLSL